MRDEARRNQHQPPRQVELELQNRGERDLESQSSTATGTGKGKAGGKGKGYLGPRSSNCGWWVVVLVGCAVIVAVAFVVAHAITNVK
ncbi:hypothetical protein N7G274_004852 [Stereocaulon virgatum]|uniref:Uncharacterized protein n=1 Tax=Stereocaulon virgatum TaxID=373712 RepID=A0ABR4ABB9_9LECA